MIVHVNTVECVGFQVGVVVVGFMDEALISQSRCLSVVGF